LPTDFQELSFTSPRTTGKAAFRGRLASRFIALQKQQKCKQKMPATVELAQAFL